MRLFEELERCFVVGTPDAAAMAQVAEMNMVAHSTNNVRLLPTTKSVHSPHSGRRSTVVVHSSKRLSQSPTVHALVDAANELRAQPDPIEDFNRAEILQQLERFYAAHPEGPLALVEKAANVYYRMQVEQNSLQSTYQERS